VEETGPESALKALPCSPLGAEHRADWADPLADHRADLGAELRTELLAELRAELWTEHGDVDRTHLLAVDQPLSRSRERDNGRAASGESGSRDSSFWVQWIDPWTDE